MTTTTMEVQVRHASLPPNDTIEWSRDGGHNWSDVENDIEGPDTDDVTFVLRTFDTSEIQATVGTSTSALPLVVSVERNTEKFIKLTANGTSKTGRVYVGRLTTSPCRVPTGEQQPLEWLLRAGAATLGIPLPSDPDTCPGKALDPTPADR